MKKILFLSLFISFKMFGQSVLLMPSAISKQSSSTDDIILTTYGIGVPAIIGRSANGSVAAPTALTSGDFLNFIGGRGYNGSFFTNSSNIYMAFRTTQNWTTTANGASIVFATTPNNSINRVERLIIDHDGSVGIGTPTPTATLDVARGIVGNDGTAIFRGTNHVSHFNYATDEDTYIRGGKDGSKVIINDGALGNVGVGTINPLEKLHVVGNIRSSSLAGTGVRNVYATANGTLTTTPTKISHYSIPNIAFNDDIPSSTFLRTDVQTYYNDAAIHAIYAPIMLPDGSTITDFAVRYLDQSANTLTFSLIVGNINGTAPTIIPLGSSTNALSGVTNTTGMSVNIDNFNKTYALRINGNWDNGNLRIFGALLRYSN
jgi:hypothetical protein